MTATNMCSNFGSKWYSLPEDVGLTFGLVEIGAINIHCSNTRATVDNAKREVAHIFYYIDDVITIGIC